jgi:hypothetical protein
MRSQADKALAANEEGDPIGFGGTEAEAIADLKCEIEWRRA